VLGNLFQKFRVAALKDAAPAVMAGAAAESFASGELTGVVKRQKGRVNFHGFNRASRAGPQ
jgi:hypothetical protein